MKDDHDIQPAIRVALTLDTSEGMEPYHVYGDRFATEDALHLTGHFNGLDDTYDNVERGAEFLSEFEERLYPYIWMESSDGYFLLDDFNVSVDFAHERSIGEMSAYIYIDPRRAFGDGKHPTTVLCMKLLAAHLHALPPEKRSGLSLMDIGTGTGILSILAARYGLRDITGIDIHDRAVTCARENLVANACEFVNVMHGDLAVFDAGRRFDIVLANIITDVILEYFEKIVAMVRGGGLLIMSGILARRAGEVTSLVSRSGLLLLDELQMDGWTGLLVGTAGDDRGKA
jgi:ribosomal protein L11 methyltransferase